MSSGMLLLVGACGGGASPTGSTGLGTVTIRLDSDWDTLDPANIATIQAEQPIKAMYDRLVAPLPSGDVQPYLATSWTTGPGTVNFTVRTDATCADGTPLTTKVIADSFTRMFSVGSAEVSGAVGPKPWSSVAVDSTHVQITAGGDSTEVVNWVAQPFASIVCPAGLQPGANFQTTDYGSGPYSLVSAVHGQSITLKRRADWKWGPPKTDYASMPKEIDLRVVTDETTAANLVSTRGIDVAEVQGVDITRLLKNSSLTAIKFSNLGVSTGYFNERPARPVSDAQVREALVRAVNDADYVRGAGTGNEVAKSINASTWSCFKDLSSVLPETGSADLAKSKSILAADGWTAGSDGILTKNGQKLTIVLLAIDTEKAGPQYIQAQWSQLGVNVVYHQYTRSQWLSDLLALNYDFVIDVNNNPRGAQAPLGSALGPFYPNGPNVFGANNPDAFAALNAERSAANATDRCNDYTNLATSLFQHYDIMPLAEITTYYFTHGIKFLPSSDNAIEVMTIRP